MPVTGAQYEIAGHGHRAVVTGVGAGLRVLTADGFALVETYDADESPPMGAGGVLVPWPNRVAGARFAWRGREYHPEVTEPARGNAIHGVLRRVTWEPVAHTDDAVTLAADVAAGPGWPEPLHVETTWSVGADGLTATHAVTNTGSGDVPVGLGVHPYLRVGDAPVADCVLTVPTEQVLDVDDARIPVGAPRAVTAGEDLSTGRRVGDLDLDTCFRLRPHPGEVHLELRAPDGSGTRLRADASFPWAQVFTPASPFAPGATAVAVEPMTCPPDALNSGTDLAVVAAGETWTVRWGLERLAP